MSTRATSTSTTLRAYEADAPLGAVLFVHGLGGSYRDDYWGKLPLFLTHARDLTKADISFWQYPTHKRPSPRTWELIVKRRLPSVATISDSFSTQLSTSCSTRKYKNIVLMGHSLGGLVLFEYIRRAMKQKLPAPVKAIAILGSPFRAPTLAKWIARMQLGTNDHINYLSNDRDLRNLMIDGLTCCRSLGIQTWYVASDQDEIVESDEIYRLFDEKHVVPGPHVWMPEIDTVQHAGYQLILNAARKSCAV